MANSAGQERTLLDTGNQLFEEARRAVQTALGGCHKTQEKLKNDKLTGEERNTLETVLDAGIADAERLTARAKALKGISDGAEVLRAHEEDPNYRRPMGADDPAAAAAGAGEDLGGRRDEDPAPRGGWEPGDPRQAAVLRGKPRVLLNRLLRGGVRGGIGGGVPFHRLSRQEQDILTRERPETLMSPYVDRDGGMITAVEFRNEVIGRLRDQVSIRARARVIATTAASIAFPTAKIDVELKKTRAGRGTGTPPVSLRDIFGKIRFTPDGHGLIIKVPEQLLADATFDIIGFLAQEVAENDQETEENFFLNGSGRGEPLGILTHVKDLTLAGAVGLEIPLAAANTVTPEDIRSFPLNLPIKYRQDGTWMYSRAFLKKVALLRTNEGGANTGEFLFQRALALGLPNTLDGHAAVESEFYPDNTGTGPAQGDPLATFGALRHYWIVDRASMDVRVLAELYTETDEVGYKYEKRYDAAPVRAGAFRNLVRGA